MRCEVFSYAYPGKIFNIAFCIHFIFPSSFLSFFLSFIPQRISWKVVISCLSKACTSWRNICLWHTHFIIYISMIKTVWLCVKRLYTCMYGVCVLKVHWNESSEWISVAITKTIQNMRLNFVQERERKH